MAGDAVTIMLGGPELPMQSKCSLSLLYAFPWMQKLHMYSACMVYTSHWVTTAMQDEGCIAKHLCKSWGVMM